MTIQVIAFVAFIALFIGMRRGGWSAEAAHLPMQLDPLAMLTNLLASRTFLLGSALALVTVALTLGLGRVWCGWLCPLGTLLDWFPFNYKRWREKQSKPSEMWRAVKYGLLIAIVIAALFSNLTLMIFDPLTIMFRSLTVGIWPAFDAAISAAQGALYQVSVLRPFVSSLDSVLRPMILPPHPVIYRDMLLFGGVLLGIILLNLAAERFWCRYLCPLGAFNGLLGKVGIVRRNVNESCIDCGACARVCPTATVNPAKGYASDPGECTMCLKCLEACPSAAIDFPAGFSVAKRSRYDPSLRHFLASMGAVVVMVALFRFNLFFRRDNPYLVLPPGCEENELRSMCIRCGECIRACPTSAIQPARIESGVEGLWVPVLVLRMGYCDYLCNACGQVCPVQAIPPLSLAKKQRTVLGKAQIDRQRCLPWAEGQPCIVCEEMCPVPRKAITLETVEVRRDNGRVEKLQRPYVLRGRCIGCGICETKCPVDGEAAIRVSGFA